MPKLRTSATDELRALPSVDRVIGDHRLLDVRDEFPWHTIATLVREELDSARAAIARGGSAPTVAQLTRKVIDLTKKFDQSVPRSVINATGVILHTNLGRAPLSEAAVQAIAQSASSYSDLEYSIAEGARGSRQQHIERLLTLVTGAEAAIVVNNNASALLLSLAGLAREKEVIVSRGEAVEVGGGFRIPDVMRQSGAKLVEVGTTNRTYVQDYEEAITEATAALLKVHTSNFRISGFAKSPDLEELVALARANGIPMIYDLGSGCLTDTRRFGLRHEPTVQQSLRAGVNLTLFSGDKLVGGPQAGIIVGTRKLVQRLAKHPLARAFRIDKLSLAGLSATLLHYLRDEHLDKVPVWRMIKVTDTEIQVRAQRWADLIGPQATIEPAHSTIGGGSLPDEVLPTWIVAVRPKHLTPQKLARQLRLGTPPIIARVIEQKVALDPRTVLPTDEDALIEKVRDYCGMGGSQ